MSASLSKSLRSYADLLGKLKSRIRQAQTRAILSANAEMIRLYRDIGHLVLQRQESKGWGASVIPRLARDIRHDLPEVKGFSERNIGYMIQFAREYPILHQPVAKLLAGAKGSILQQPVARLRSGPTGSKLEGAAQDLSAKRPAPIMPQAVAQLAVAAKQTQSLVAELP